MAKKLEQLRSGKEFVKYAEHSPAAREIRQNGTSHVIIHTDRGMAVVPNHAEDLGKGLRSKLVKTFIAIGLTVLALGCLLAPAVQAFAK